MQDSFGARGQLSVGDQDLQIARLDAVLDGAALERMPYASKVLLENLLRHEDGALVTADDIRAFADRQPGDEPRPLSFVPARILMQDFTGVPCVVDLAAMREAVVAFGGRSDVVEPQAPTELVIDHSISADVYGTPDAFKRNGELEFERNRERYDFLRWGQQAFDSLLVVPPNTGICHQVNLEYLARVVFRDPDGWAYPDTLVGTDSHTPMVNGLGVLGWGVGGIEAEAAMLRQPVSILTPEVVGLTLTGQLPEGATATDLVLTVTELLRQHGVVGKFVEFTGPGVGEIGVPDRATLGNMSPEYGSTVSIFPIDDQTLRYLRFTGRPDDQVALVEGYAKEQGLWHDPSVTPVYDEALELDLSTVEPSLAGPSRPQDRVGLPQVAGSFRAALADHRGVPVEQPVAIQSSCDDAVEATFPASDPVAPGTEPCEDDQPHTVDGGGPDVDLQSVPVTLEGREPFELTDGDVVIAAITSCTNTSNPSVMLGAGLLAKRAVEAGLEVPPWVKTTLAPGSKVVTDYFDEAGLTPYLEKLGFYLAGYGCTTCIGNSGPLLPELSQAVEEGDLAVAAVLSGNRNFEGRINPDVRANYLASPPLVIAYALAGTVDIDLSRDPVGHDQDRNPVMLADLWPSSQEVAEAVDRAVRSSMFTKTYATILDGDERWNSLDTPPGDTFRWTDDSTYIRRPPYFEGLGAEPDPLTDIDGARCLVLLGDSVTTDHISPAGAIRPDSPAGQWLQEHGVQPADFNSYGSRRGNHEVMIRGTFANIRLRNQLAPGTEGPWTRHFPSGEQLSIYDAAERYHQEGVPLVVLAGREYGSGSSRDWAAKGTALLGVRAVLAESFERIHRSNLVGMGVLPLQLPASVEELGLTGEETFTITGLTDPDALLDGEVTVTADDRELTAAVLIGTPAELDYYRHGGILPYVLRRLVAEG